MPLDTLLTETTVCLRPALALVLFRDGVLSLGAAAKVSASPLSDFIQHLNELDIDIAEVDETTESEEQDISAWLKPHP